MINEKRKKAMEIIYDSDQDYSSSRQIYDADGAYEMLVHNVLNTGRTTTDSRVGKGTIRKFGMSYVVDVGLSFPIITTKAIKIENVAAEIFWFLSGSNNVESLQQVTSIWDDWADENGNLESAYGRFWRAFPFIPVGGDRPGETITTHEDDYYAPDGVDQIWAVVQNLKENPFSRRHHVTAWHPDNALASRLPPCHHSFTLYCENTHRGKNRLNMEVHQRSGDVAVGIPYNMAGYGLLLNLLARETDMQPGKLKHTITDAHIYLSHAEKLARQVSRQRRGGTVELDLPEKSLFDLTVEDARQVSLDGYEHRDPVSFDVKCSNK